MVKRLSCPGKDKDRLMAHDEDHLLRDAMKKFRQAFAMGCLVIAKTRTAEDQRVQENVELHKEIDCLQSEIKHSNGLQQEAEQI